MTTNLLQFKGTFKRDKIGLQIYLTEDGSIFTNEEELVRCTKCQGYHPQVYIAYRKPVEPFGHFIVFRLNGKEIVPDLSLPIPVDRLPRDAIKLSKVENSKLWHSE